ncbi:MAG TPA: periplasmic heavy metal sensor [bacterium]|nr:periplasmic heavy metal sensor [bacterium]
MRKLMFFAILMTSALALAQCPNHGKGGPGGPEGGPKGDHKGHMMMMHDEMLKEIGVAEAQRAEFRASMHETHKKMMDIQFKIKEERIAMKAEAEKASPDKAKLQKSIQKIADLRRDQTLLMENHKLEMLLKLTPDQRKKALEFMQNRKKMMMNHMMGPGPDGDDD